jgi:Short C-terminal domain
VTSPTPTKGGCDGIRASEGTPPDDAGGRRGGLRGAGKAAGGRKAAEDQDEPQEVPPAPPPPAPTSGGSEADELQQLADLHDAGTLTDDEFAAAKAKVLGT